MALHINYFGAVSERNNTNEKGANVHNNDGGVPHNIVHRILKGAIYILLKYL